MIRHGTAPFLECSTRGERRLSAFNARPSMLNGRSIEEAYQCSKVLPDGSRPMHWREGKGKRATNANELALLYTQWWRAYIRENADLLALIRRSAGLSDMFGQPGHICQATVLWNIRNDPTF